MVYIYSFKIMVKSLQYTSFIVNKKFSHDYKIWFQLDKDICRVTRQLQGKPPRDVPCKNFIAASCSIPQVILSKLKSFCQVSYKNQKTDKIFS